MNSSEGKAAPRMLVQFGGRLSMSGVRYVLDQASFQDVDALPSPAFTALIGQLSKIVLRLLRICMAQRNSKARELIQDGIGPEIEELYMALTASSFEIPKNILPMNDSQREHWYGKMKHAKHSGESKDPGTGERVVPAHPLSESLVREVRASDQRKTRSPQGVARRGLPCTSLATAERGFGFGVPCAGEKPVGNASWPA